MPNGPTEQLHLCLPRDLSRAIDDFRREMERPPSRPHAAVELIRLALARRAQASAGSA
jgi:hypothetical protein